MVKEGLKTRVLDLDYHHLSLYATAPQLISIHLAIQKYFLSASSAPAWKCIFRSSTVSVFMALVFRWVRLPKPNQ